MSRRRSKASSVVTIYWRDIPAQVTAGRGPGEAKVLLDARFQHAIDRAATVAGKTDTASYVAEWRRTTEPLSGEPAAAATARAAALEADHPPAVLEQLVSAGGQDLQPQPAAEPEPHRSTGAQP